MMNIQMVRERVPHYQHDDYGRRIVNEAKLWSSFARKHSALTERRVQNMALDAVAFTLRHRAHHFAMPTKLVGTREHQNALQGLDQSSPEPWLQLSLVASEGRVEAHAGAFRLGWIWSGHSWLWPLLTVGVEARLIAVTGTDQDWKWLGCNVVFTGLADAIQKTTERPQPAPPSKYPDYVNRPPVNGQSA